MMSVFLSDIRTYVQGWAKKLFLDCVNSRSTARGSQEAGFTQPGDHSFAQPCWCRYEKEEYLFPLNKPFEFHFLTDFSRFPLLSPLDVRRHKKPISSGLRVRRWCLVFLPPRSRGCLKPQFKRNVNFDFQGGHMIFSDRNYKNTIS